MKPAAMTARPTARRPVTAMTATTALRALASLLPLAALLLAAGPAAAFPAACGYDVSRDVSSTATPTPRPPLLPLDGAMLARFARGQRGPALFDGVTTSPDRIVGEGNIGMQAGRFDLDGDGVLNTTDAMIAARYMAGVRGAALLTGLSISAFAARPTATAIEAYIGVGCQGALPAVTMQRHAARLLQQGTYGPTLAEIQRVATLGSTPAAMTTAWLDEQFTRTPTRYADYAQLVVDQNKTAPFDWRCTGDSKSWGCAWAANTPGFFKFAIEGEDQLRQRVTNALGQIIVVSISNNTILDAGVALPDFWDMLSRHAFGGTTTDVSGRTVGSFRSIIRDTTLHPAMGIFLDMLGSTAEVPNENYPRELLQLFTIGTVWLNLDGTPQLDANGRTIPTYDEDTVLGLSRALTGWHYNNADANVSEPWRFYWPNRDWRNPMQPWSLRRCPQNGRWPPGTPDGAPGSNDPAICWSWCDIKKASCSFPPPHNRDAKRLLQYPNAPFANLAAIPAPSYPSTQDHTLAAVRDEVRAAARSDLERLVDNVFYHPNIGPFIARQMIQRLVTSNPTPGYVARVAAKFNDNGAGVRGDMGAVVRAIYLDTEARDFATAMQPWFGKLREPLVKFIQLHRAFGARETVEGYYDIWDTSGPDSLGQGALRPPSVFNFYSPTFGPSGPLSYPTIRPIEGTAMGTLADDAMVGPEFEITSTSSIAGFGDFFNWAVYNGFRRTFSGNGLTRDLRWATDYSRYLGGATPLADNPQALVDELDLLLTAGNLKPAFRANLAAMVAGITRTDLAQQRNERLQAVLWQIANSADYAIQR